MKPIYIMMMSVIISLSTLTAKAEEDPRINGTSAEGPFYDFYLGKDLNGYVKTRPCEDCKEVTITIKPGVKAQLDNKPVKLERFVLSKHQPSTLHFDRAGKLARIDWHTK